MNRWTWRPRHQPRLEESILRLWQPTTYSRWWAKAAHRVMRCTGRAIDMRGTIWLVGALAATLGIGAAAIVRAWPIGDAEHLGSIEGEAWRGAYLARASGCVSCHTAPGGAALAGGAPLETPFGTFVPPNITPDPIGGIGNWTLDEFAVAVRQGISPDGEPYYPAFMYEFYGQLSDQDLADMWAAVREVPPIAEPAAAHDLSFPFNLRFGLKLWRAAFMAEPTVSPVLGRSELWNRGQQLVEGSAHCAACHTGRNLAGGLDPDEAMAGSDALPDGGTAPSIRAEDLAARGWTAASLAYALRTGMAVDGDALGGSMAEVVQAGTSFLDEADREAIAAYIMNVDEIGSESAIAAAANAGSMDGMDHTSMVGMDASGSGADALTEVKPMDGIEDMADLATAASAQQGTGGAAPLSAPSLTSVGPVTGLPLPRFVSLRTDEGNTRRGPSLDQRIDWVFVRENMPLQITAEHDNWRRVEDREGQGGWVHYSLLSGTRTVIVDKDRLPLRSSPVDNAPEIALLEQNVVARLQSCEVEWCRISAGGYGGWALKADLWGVGADEVLD